ncbi:chaperone modulatory protein CbpM [Desulfobaculum xiamenense]|uniref:Chaperone modulatory protein CbpM n=1 Tax=Desulfobaculum xiamenense TaxID=995050 RepID=A0A846QHN6_9BACT|nr:chaperone modulator CbpM [Desulfobaculum xiamenense]NJB67778.1 chaperone modulatory protein CbpM [Desulfobaculum xiamenense]
MDLTKLETGAVPEPSNLVTWVSFIELTAVHPSRLTELIDIGWVEPLETSARGVLFHQRDVYRVRKLVRLCADLEVGVTGGMIIVDLLARIENLEHKVRELERLV